MLLADVKKERTNQHAQASAQMRSNKDNNNNRNDDHNARAVRNRSILPGAGTRKVLQLVSVVGDRMIVAGPFLPDVTISRGDSHTITIKTAEAAVIAMQEMSRRLHPTSLSAILDVGPAFDAMYGAGLMSYNLFGPVMRRCQTLLDGTPAVPVELCRPHRLRSRAYATELFWRTYFSHLITGFKDACDEAAQLPRWNPPPPPPRDHPDATACSDQQGEDFVRWPLPAPVPVEATPSAPLVMPEPQHPHHHHDDDDDGDDDDRGRRGDAAKNSRRREYVRRNEAVTATSREPFGAGQPWRVRGVGLTYMYDLDLDATISPEMVENAAAVLAAAVASEQV